jgi:hypothetical protein
MVRAALARWLFAPPMSGWPALIVAVVAVGIPTAVRWAVNGVVTGCEFTPYLPFVLLGAMLLRWWAAAGVALASVAIMGGVLGGAPAHGILCFLDSAAMFLASSLVMIGVAIFVRLTIATLQKRGADESSGGVIFSLEKGEVWASWYGGDAPMLLGSQPKVSAMMADFLQQEELGRRLGAK